VVAEDALLLIAHGSSRYTDAARVLRGHVQRISAAGSFREVEMGLLNGTPSVAEAVARLTAPVTRVVPFFMENGYFSRVVVPHTLGLADAVRGRFLLCPAVGVHPGMAELITARVLDRCGERGIEPAATSVVIVGHGSARAPGRALALHSHVKRVAAMGVFAAVNAACLEEAPFLADVLRGQRDRAVAVLGFFAGEGGHVRDDVPTLIAAEQSARGPGGPEVHYLGPVAEAPAMTQIILDQAHAV
jgi:sirohydrochlorin cobaltochelatase